MVKSIGQSSFAVAQNLYQNEQCVASADSVLVQVDQTTRRPKKLDDTTRAALALFMPAQP